MRTVYCLDCNKLLNRSAYYKNAKRCRSCGQKRRFKLGKPTRLGKKNSKESKQKMSKSMRKLHKSPAFREKMTLCRSLEKHWNWKGGVRETYHRIARKIYNNIYKIKVCAHCGTSDNIHIHHVDENWKNNGIKNLQALCNSCHVKHHRPHKKRGRSVR